MPKKHKEDEQYYDIDTWDKEEGNWMTHSEMYCSQAKAVASAKDLLDLTSRVRVVRVQRTWIGEWPRKPRKGGDS